MEKDYVYQEYIRREENILHAQYDPELEFYSVIKSGNVDKTKELCSIPIGDKAGLGELSLDPIQNLKYHFVISTAITARYCIEGGLDMSTAFSLSDYYIKKADMATTKEKINELHTAVCIEYATRMKNLRKKRITSKPIAKSIDYISEHLHTKITLENLAEHTKLNPSYLSRLFKQETGLTISEYIQNTRIETAKNMLIYSDYSSAEIASILSFSDQSYFTEVFKKHTGLTPKKYQSMHLNQTEIGNNYKKQ